MPKVSVIVPVYNVEKLLERCLNSVLNQSFQDFELLLIDDGSKDSSGQICDNYAKKISVCAFGIFQMEGKVQLETWELIMSTEPILFLLTVMILLN
nr:glycosyltransferase family 2 protein [Lactococcus cremoris]